jgi:hypothetical protein
MDQRMKAIQVKMKKIESESDNNKQDLDRLTLPVQFNLDAQVYENFKACLH